MGFKFPRSSDTVVSETTFGKSPSAGVKRSYSRGDHTHGTPDALNIASHLLPAADGTYDLGSLTRRWRDGYLQRIRLDRASDPLVYLRDTTYGYFFYLTITAGRALIVANTIIDVASTLRPSSDNAYDLGAADLSWRSAWFKGRVDTNLGVLRLPSGVSPITPQAGDCRYNSATDTFEIYDGTTWHPH